MCGPSTSPRSIRLRWAMDPAVASRLKTWVTPLARYGVMRSWTFRCRSGPCVGCLFGPMNPSEGMCTCMSVRPGIIHLPLPSTRTAPSGIGPCKAAIRPFAITTVASIRGAPPSTMVTTFTCSMTVMAGGSAWTLFRSGSGCWATTEAWSASPIEGWAKEVRAVHSCTGRIWIQLATLHRVALQGTVCRCVIGRSRALRERGHHLRGTVHPNALLEGCGRGVCG